MGPGTRIRHPGEGRGPGWWKDLDAGLRRHDEPKGVRRAFRTPRYGRRRFV